MRNLFLLVLLLSTQVFAKAPECPLYASKEDCLESVEENYRRFLEFIEEEDAKEQMIEAALSIKHFESLACQKTCVN
jgi:hypothetical protein